MPDFLSVLWQPRITMRRILDAQRYRWWPLALLAFCVTALRDPGNVKLTKMPPSVQPWLIVAGAIVGGALVGILIFYGLSWVAYFIGKAFEGTGSPREVRAAAAWGLAPMIVSGVYRIPLSYTVHDKADVLNPTACSAAVLLLTIEFLTFCWYVTIASGTIAEAHRFSAWRGLATVGLTWLSPLVIIIAAVLALH